MKFLGTSISKLILIALVLVLLAVSVVSAAPVEKPAPLPGTAVVALKVFYSLHAYDDYNVMVNGQMYRQTNDDGSTILISIVPGVPTTIVVLDCATPGGVWNNTVTMTPGDKSIFDVQVKTASSCE